MLRVELDGGSLDLLPCLMRQDAKPMVHRISHELPATYSTHSTTCHDPGSYPILCLQQTPAPGQPGLKAQPAATDFPATPENTSELPSYVRAPGVVPPVVVEEEGKLRFIGSLTPDRTLTRLPGLWCQQRAWGAEYA